jgi:hypothetical protein
MSYKLLALGVGMCLTLAAGAAWASPLWYPEPGSTYQQWDFNSSANPAGPEIDLNPYGHASATLEKTSNGSAMSWADGVWSSSEFKLTLSVPNNPVSNDHKDMVVELRFQGDIFLSWAVDQASTQFTRTDRVVSTEGNWTIVKDTYYLQPNPPSEYLCYGFNNGTALAAVDYVKIDTRCVPEPLSLGLLGLGGLLLGRRRRSRHT